MPKILVDHRERNSGIIRELIKNGLEVEEQQLISADFVIQSKTIEDKINTIGIERKQQNDFINSIIDKRILNQLRLLKENFSIPLLIIEGHRNIYSIRNFHPNAIRGMLSAIAIDFQIPIIYTRNHRDTAALLTTIAKRLETPKNLLLSLKKKKPLTLKEQQQYLIESLPGIGPSLSKALLTKFGSVKKIINAEEHHLQKIDKIGPKKIKKIKEVIESSYEE